MSAWAAGTGSDQAASASVSQVRIWNAASQASGLSPAGLVYPTGSLAVKMATRAPTAVGSTELIAAIDLRLDDGHPDLVTPGRSDALVASAWLQRYNS